jgi:uncharacterized Zn finger protein
MSNRAMPFGNDNIRTSHLKCDQCKARTFLQDIERSQGFEIRLFACVHCGAVKTIQIGAPDPIAVSS